MGGHYSAESVMEAMPVLYAMHISIWTVVVGLPITGQRAG